MALILASTSSGCVTKALKVPMPSHHPTYWPPASLKICKLPWNNSPPLPTTYRSVLKDWT